MISFLLVVVMVSDLETKVAKPVAYLYKGMTFGVSFYSKAWEGIFSLTLDSDINLIAHWSCIPELKKLFIYVNIHGDIK